MNTSSQKTLTALLAATALLFPFPVFAAAGAATGVKPKTNIATITSVSPTTDSFTINTGASNKMKITGENHSEQTYKVNKLTTITVNGIKSTLADLKAGMKVDVTRGMDRDVASSVVAYGTPPAASTPKPGAGSAKGKGKNGNRRTKPLLQLGQAITEDKIVAVGADSVTIGADGGKELKAYKLAKGAQIIVNGKKAELSALHAGMKVQVRVGMDPHTVASITASN